MRWVQIPWLTSQKSFKNLLTNTKVSAIIKIQTKEQRAKVKVAKKVQKK